MWWVPPQDIAFVDRLVALAQEDLSRYRASCVAAARLAPRARSK
jgi:hypothetical protein